VTSKLLQWDIFCHVIDNHGDLGVSWRLAFNLAERGHSVRLWVDDASALDWMAPAGSPHVRVIHWPEAETALTVGDVVIEAFGCRLPNRIEDLIVQEKATWINLEYLSAESFVEASHGLPSPIMLGPAKGFTQWFFYPGFGTGSGGLMRERDLQHRQTVFNRRAWLARFAPRTSNARNVSQHRFISLFCYEPICLKALLIQLANNPSATSLLVTQGRSQSAVVQALKMLNMPTHGAHNLHIEYLPYLSQEDFDHLLWACDLNFVRGEDSLVRALWAGKPFVWQIYPQDDQAHHLKLQAFCEKLAMPHDLSALHAIWNNTTDALFPQIASHHYAAWGDWAHQTAMRLAGQQDLTTQLEQFVHQKR
jgi:uncharacterized repeat protein (TIGR03837 family)